MRGQESGDPRPIGLTKSGGGRRGRTDEGGRLVPAATTTTVVQDWYGHHDSLWEHRTGTTGFIFPRFYVVQKEPQI